MYDAQLDVSLRGSAKDEFLSIKSATRNDLRDAHHIPPQLMGAMQEDNGSLSDVEKAASRLGLSGEIINKKLCNIYHFYVKKTQGFLASLMI